MQDRINSLGKILDATEIAHISGLSRSGISNLIDAGKFPSSISVWGFRRWKYEDVKAWIDNQEGGIRKCIR